MTTTTQPQTPQAATLALLERIATVSESTEQKIDILIELIKRMGDALNANTAEILFLKQQQGIMPQSQAAIVPPLPSVEMGGRVLAEDKRTQIQPVNGEVVETLTVSTVAYEFSNGKPVFRAKGGRFAKFGVAIYPEVLPLLGLDAGNLQFGENPFGKNVLAIVRQGKPVKVIGLAQ